MFIVQEEQIMPAPASQPAQKQTENNTTTVINQSLASIVTLIGSFLIEKNFFQNSSVPITTAIYLANDLIKLLNHKEQDTQPEKMSLYKEFTIMGKLLVGKELTPAEQRYENDIHELNVTGEILNGIKYATSFSLLKNLYHSVSSTLSQGLWEHAPAIIGSAAAVTAGPYLLSRGIEKVLDKTNLSAEQKEFLRPWLNTIGRLALAFTPKVAAGETGVRYQYASAEGYTKLFQKIKIEVPADSTANLLPDKPGATLPSENIDFKLCHIAQGKNEAIEIFVINNNNEEIRLDLLRDENKKLIIKCPDVVVARDLEKLFTNKIITDTPKAESKIENEITQINVAGNRLDYFPLFPVLLAYNAMTSNVFPLSLAIGILAATNFGNSHKVLAQGTNSLQQKRSSIPFLISDLNGGNDGIATAQLLNGSYIAIWDQAVNLNKALFGIVVDGNNKIGSKFQINPELAAGDKGTASIAVLPNGNFVVAFGYYDGSAWGIYLQMFDTNINPIGSVIKVNTSHIGGGVHINTLSVASSSNGNFLVVWYSGYSEIYGRLFNSNRAPLGGEFNISDVSSSYAQVTPTAVNLSNGNFIIVWTNATHAPSGIIVYKILDVNGNNITNTLQLSVDDYAINPDLARLSNGDIAVVWNGGSFGNGQMLNPDGSIKGNVFFWSGGAPNPKIRPLNQTRFVISSGPTGGSSGPTVGIYDGSSNLIGKKFSTDSLGNYIAQDTLILSNGDLLAVWNPSAIYGESYNTHTNATYLNQSISYNNNYLINPITIQLPAFLSNVTAQMQVSDINAGWFDTATVGSTTSTYNYQSGVWQAVGNVNDVNQLLANLQFQQTLNYKGNFQVLVSIDDNFNPPLNGTISAIGPPQPTPNPTPTSTLPSPKPTPVGTPNPSPETSVSTPAITTPEQTTRMPVTTINSGNDPLILSSSTSNTHQTLALWLGLSGGALVSLFLVTCAYIQRQRLQVLKQRFFPAPIPDLAATAEEIKMQRQLEIEGVEKKLTP